MKLNLLCGAAFALVSASAGAQTCASPDTTWHPDGAGSPALAANTCAAETSFLTYCDQGGSATGSAYVARVTTTPAATYTQVAVSSNAATFTAILGVIPVAQGCAAAPIAGDTGHCITSSSLAVQKANIPAGDYYFIVTKADFDADGACGDFTLTANGTLPVSLQNFTVS